MLFKGGQARGLLPGVIYPMATVVEDTDVIFFIGEGDSCLSYSRISKKRLNELFIPI
jgi:hypothetical protein